MAVVVEAFDGRVLDCPVHALDLAVGLRMVGLGQAVLDPVGLADHVEAHRSRIGGVSIPGLLGELDAIVRQDRMDTVGNSLQQMLQELPGCPPVGFFDELGDGKLAGAIDCHEEV